MKRSLNELALLLHDAYVIVLVQHLDLIIINTINIITTNMCTSTSMDSGSRPAPSEMIWQSTEVVVLPRLSFIRFAAAMCRSIADRVQTMRV